VAYALLSGALGQIDSMSLDNQRNLKLAIHKKSLFLQMAEQVAEEMNKWAPGFLGHDVINDWPSQLNFATKIFRAGGLYLDDRHMRGADGVAIQRPNDDEMVIHTALIILHNITVTYVRQAYYD